MKRAVELGPKVCRVDWPRLRSRSLKMDLKRRCQNQVEALKLLEKIAEPLKKPNENKQNQQKNQDQKNQDQKNKDQQNKDKKAAEQETTG